jgi:uncharacterized protein YndB with AHSA1/START domain
MNDSRLSDTIVEEITIKARADQVFAALTSPDHVLKWWRREGQFQVTHMESDLRPGGKWLMRGTTSGDKAFSVHGVYREVDRGRALAFTWNPSWQDHASESLVRFDLEEKGGVTTVRLTHSGLTESARAQHRGWPGILAWLRAYTERNA